MGSADVQTGDAIHAVSTSSEGTKGVIETSALTDVDQLTQVILGNSDEEVTMVLERPGAGPSMGFLDGIVRMF